MRDDDDRDLKVPVDLLQKLQNNFLLFYIRYNSIDVHLILLLQIPVHDRIFGSIHINVTIFHDTAQVNTSVLNPDTGHINTWCLISLQHRMCAVRCIHNKHLA